jgi:hypothetical protein
MKCQQGCEQSFKYVWITFFWSPNLNIYKHSSLRFQIKLNNLFQRLFFKSFSYVVIYVIMYKSLCKRGGLLH